MSLIHWWNARRNAKLEQALTKPQNVDLTKPADMTYPPPSAYEIQQITKELKLNSHMMSRPTDRDVRKKIN